SLAELRWFQDLLATSERAAGTLTTLPSITAHWAARLHSSVDGKHLIDSKNLPAACSWLADGTLALSGKQYLNLIALRADSLPTRLRMARGNNGNRQCRHHCNAFETSNHAIQRCHATHGLRVKRHDNLVAMVASRLKERGYR